MTKEQIKEIMHLVESACNAWFCVGCADLSMTRSQATVVEKMVEDKLEEFMENTND